MYSKREGKKKTFSPLFAVFLKKKKKTACFENVLYSNTNDHDAHLPVKRIFVSGRICIIFFLYTRANWQRDPNTLVIEFINSHGTQESVGRTCLRYLPHT